ncbi:hypothetical protein J6590_023267 [Homalodisca vitripennis]|nr:hypothetical protein J6590_023267 [Homalodisca vitripennis]
MQQGQPGREHVKGDNASLAWREREDARHGLCCVLQAKATIIQLQLLITDSPDIQKIEDCLRCLIEVEKQFLKDSNIAEHEWVLDKVLPRRNIAKVKGHDEARKRCWVVDPPLLQQGCQCPMSAAFAQPDPQLSSDNSQKMKPRRRQGPTANHNHREPG